MNAPKQEITSVTVDKADELMSDEIAEASIQQMLNEDLSVRIQHDLAQE